MDRNLFKQFFDPNHKPSRNAFDLSREIKYTAQVGDIMPIMCEECVPGDYFKFNPSVFARTKPLNTAAFLRCKVIYDFVFVPMTAIWHYWPSFYYQRPDFGSAYMAEDGAPKYSPVFNLKDAINYIRGYATDIGGCRLLDMLGYGAYYDLVTAAPPETESDYPIADINKLDFWVNALPLYAYQKAFYSLYVAKHRLPSFYEINWPYNYNADLFYGDTFEHSKVTQTVHSSLSRILSMHRHLYRKDLLTASLAEQQYGSVSSIDVTGLFYIDYPSGAGASIARGNLIKTMPISLGDTQVGVGTAFDQTETVSAARQFTLKDAVSALSVRQMEALQAWKEQVLRGGFRSKDQQKAIFGVNPKNMSEDDVIFINSFDMTISVDEVVSTANTATPETAGSVGNLGQLGGKAVSYSSGADFSFECSDHGYLMCLASIVPDIDYNNDCIALQNVRSTAFDYYNPFMDRLGLTPIYAHEFILRDLADIAYRNNVVGFAPRYHEYKTRQDRVHGDFGFEGTLQAFNAVRRDLPQSDLLVNNLDLYIDPAVLNNVFVNDADPMDITTDHFLFDFNMGLKAVRPMSTLGLPQF